MLEIQIVAVVSIKCVLASPFLGVMAALQWHFEKESIESCSNCLRCTD